MHGSLQRLNPVFAMGFLLVSCSAGAPSQIRAVTSTSAKASPPATGNSGPQCSGVSHGDATTAQLLVVFDAFHSLHDAIRVDSPEAEYKTIQDPCIGKSGLTWDEYHAPEANWYFSCIGNKIVAARQSKVGDSYEKDLYTRKVGNFAIAFLAKADFLCPGRPQERCYPNEAPEPLLCESDFGVPCTRDGNEGIVEVLDTANMVVHRVDDVRHVEAWNATLLPNGRLRLDVGGCSLEL